MITTAFFALFLSATTPEPPKPDLELIRCEETRTGIRCYWRQVKPASSDQKKDG